MEAIEWDVPQSFVSKFRWDYDDERADLLSLYEKGKQRQWNATTRIDWSLEFDPENLANTSVQATINAKGIWSGESDRDAHLRGADFLDVENYPEITFAGDQVEVIGDHDFALTGDLTIRGIPKNTTFKFTYLGQRQTPWWEDGVDKGPKTRAGFVATTQINRQDFGVSWSAPMDKNGLVAGNIVEITIDAEAILEDT